MSRERRPTRSAATLATVVAVLVALAVGGGLGEFGAAAVSVGGALALAAGTWALDADRNGRVAAGSVLAVTGATLLAATVVVAAGLPSLAVYAALGLGVALVAVDATTGATAETPVGAAFRESGNALLVGIVVAVLLNLAATFDVPLVLAAVLWAVVSADPLVGLVTLQLGLVLVAVLLAAVVPVLERWHPDPEPTADGPLGRLASTGRSLSEIPPVVWVGLGAQVVVVLLPPARRLFGLFLAAVPVVGDLLALALSGPLHVLLGLVVAALVGVRAAAALQVWLIDWLGDDPGRTLALQSGGIVASLGVLVGVAVVSLLETTLLSGPAGISSVVGPAAVALTALLAALIAVGVALSGPSLLAFHGLIDDRAAGFAVGTALLFLATLAAAELGLWTPLVVAGVAGALFAWDTGAHATSLGAHLGRDQVGTDGEFVHVTGTALVLGVATVIAVAARYLLVPALSLPETTAGVWRATVALVAVLVTVLAFAFALALRDDAVAG